MATDSVPRFSWVDAWLLAALTDYRWRWSRPMKLWRLIDCADVLAREEPTFDEISFSLPRLVAAGLVTVGRDAAGELQLKATRAGFDVKKRAAGRGHAAFRMANALGAARRSEDEVGDRSLGRYSDLNAADWAVARRRLDRVTLNDAD